MRRSRRVLTALTAAALSAGALSAGADAALAAPAGRVPVAAAAAHVSKQVSAERLLAGLTVRARTGTHDYERAAFGSWIDADHDCSSTATEVYSATSKRTVKPSATACHVTSGTWISAYDAARFTSPKRMRVDHAIPLRNAWVSGADHWSKARRTAFMNDLGYVHSVLAVSTASSTLRGAKDPSRWLPVAADRCTYVKSWIAVKARWGLSVTRSERTALRHDLKAYCRSVAVARPAKPDVALLNGAQATTPVRVVTPLRAEVAASAKGAVLDLAAGTHDFADFAGTIGVDVPGSVAGIKGTGSASTVLAMTPHTSTRAAAVPTAAGTTNQLSLLRVSGAPVLSGFTLQGTDQGHLYNGLRLNRTTGAALTDVTVTAVPGDDHVNPGETFGINDFHGSGTTYTHVLVDGSGVGASGLGFNSASDPVVTGSTFTRNPFSAGIAAWQTHDLTVTDSVFSQDKTGVNLERMSGAVTITRATFSANKVDLHVGSDRASTPITLIDPVFTGTLRVQVSPRYMGVANRQLRSDIHVIVHGRDVTGSVVTWIG